MFILELPTSPLDTDSFETIIGMDDRIRRSRNVCIYQGQFELITKWNHIKLWIKLYKEELDKLHAQGCNVYIKTHDILGDYND